MAGLTGTRMEDGSVYPSPDAELVVKLSMAGGMELFLTVGDMLQASTGDPQQLEDWAVFPNPAKLGGYVSLVDVFLSGYANGLRHGLAGACHDGG